MIIIKYLLCILWWVIPIVAFCQTKELDRLLENAAKVTKKGDLEQADILYDKYVNLFRQQKFQKNYNYSEILIYQARRAAQTGHVEKAIEIQKEVVEVRRTAPDCTFQQWGIAMSDLASYYSQKGDYDKAIETGQDAMEMIKKKLGTRHHDYGIVMANQAAFYATRNQQGDIKSAVALGEAAVKTMKKNSLEYANALNSLVVYYSQAGDWVKANKISGKARKKTTKRLKKDDVSYAIILNNQAIQLAKVGNYNEAIEFACDAKECFENAGNTQTLGYSKLLKNMATFYSHLQKYQEAVKLLETAMPIIEQVASKEHPDYLSCVSELAAVYKANGDLARADELANESSTMSESLPFIDNEKYARSLSRQASVFASNGNYLRAIEHEQSAYNIFMERKDSLSMAQSLDHLATFFSNDGNQPMAYETAKASLKIFREIGQNTTAYAQALNNTAILYYNGEQYSLATDYGSMARKMYEQLGDTTTTFYAHILANNALFDFVNNNQEHAITIARKALELQKKVFGEEHPDHVPLLYNLAVFYSELGNKAEAEHQYKQALIQQENLIQSAFLHLTSQEREKFWQQNNYVFKFAPMLAYLDSLNPEMSEMAYNSLLFRKGILLNSDIDFRSIIKRSGNQDLLEKYNQLENLQQVYFRQSTNQHNVDIKQVKDGIYRLERTLVRECKEYGSFTESLKVDANQISQMLADDEVAIEFADIYVQGRGNTYLAFIIRHNQPQPKMIRLFSDDELSILKYDNTEHLDSLQMQHLIDSVQMQRINSVYTDWRFGQLIWKPLMKEMTGIRRIFFSPTSLFYQLAIEYLPCDSIHRICDLYNLYRISSTKLLARRSATPQTITSAAVYGGLQYDMDLSQLQEQHTQLQQQTINPTPLLAMSTAVDTQRTLDSLSIRGSVHYLPGTLHEAQSVGELLMQNNIETDMYHGYEGTEESFKALSGRPRSIIHIATHGFYFSEKDLRRLNQRLAFLNEQTDDVANPLNYSGLLLSGANYVLNKNKLPDNYEDGVLTANEISQLDLSKTDLVVLSACLTGLGDIREDGVFGIQRGFKKAGVQSLLMSLWNVSDEATDLMMAKFYENLMSGMTKQQAFITAQEYLRNSEYAAPYFWASFILLDGF
jgi:tetratricopeptide (TPR) repeat protein